MSLNYDCFFPGYCPASDFLLAAAAAATFTGKTHKMALHRHIDVAGEFSLIVACNRFYKVSNKGEIASAMSGFGVFRNLGNLLVPNLGLAGLEIPYPELLHVAFDITERAHNPGTAPSLRSEGIHGERRCNPVLEQKVGHIMVRLVVVAMEYAAGVLVVVRIFQAAQDKLRVPVAVQVEHPQVPFLPCINIYGIVRAGICMGAGLCAIGRSSLRGVLFLEIVETPVGADRLAWFAYEPAQDVQIVAGLCEDNRGAGCGIPPDATDIGMGHMRILYGLHVLHTHDVPDCTAAKDPSIPLSGPAFAAVRSGELIAAPAAAIPIFLRKSLLCIKPVFKVS